MHSSLLQSWPSTFCDTGAHGVSQILLSRMAVLSSVGCTVMHREAQEELIERVKQAAALPVVISIKDVYDETCTELLVLANLDSGARGRPRVTYDVTAALNAMQLCVFMADVYIESPVGDTEQRPQELHRFLVHCIDGCRLGSSQEKR